MQEQQQQFFLLFLLTALIGSGLAALPRGWKTCRRSDPEFNNCLRREVVNAVSSLMRGDRSLGVLPLDPLRIDRLRIPRSPGPVSVDLEFTQLNTTGIKDFKMLQLNMSDWKTLRAKVLIPWMSGLGKYRVDGKVLILPIVGRGDVNLTSVNVELDVNITFTRVKKTENGKEYFQVDKLTTKLKPQRMWTYLTNLFNGDKALGDNMNLFLDENWALVVEELGPGLDSALSQTFTHITNQILAKIPADEIDLP